MKIFEKVENEKKLKNAIKHMWNKMRTNKEMSEEFIEFLEKWGCIKNV